LLRLCERKNEVDLRGKKCSVQWINFGYNIFFERFFRFENEINMCLPAHLTDACSTPDIEDLAIAGYLADFVAKPCLKV